METIELRRRAFFSLVCCALGSRQVEDTFLCCRDLGVEDWNSVYNLARVQTVTGLLSHALSLFPERPPGLPRSVFYRLVSEANRLEKKSLEVAQLARELTGRLVLAGLSPLVLKGPAVASYYPQPLLRETGDLDLYVPEKEIPGALACFRCMGYTIGPSPGGGYVSKGAVVDIDLHSRYFDLHVKDDLLPPIPSPQAELLMLSSHILKHSMGPGVGLRQICDMAMAYRALEGKYDKDELVLLYRRCSLERWNRLLCSYVKARLGVDTGLYDSDTAWNGLEKTVFSGGNFGHYAKGRLDALSGSVWRRKMDTGWRLLKTAPWGLRFSPVEYFSYWNQLLKGNSKEF